MLDSALRPVKDRALAPLVRTPLGRLHPTVISAAAMVLSIWAAVAAWHGAPALAVGLWLVGRVGDGIDGLSARASDRTSDLGGLADIVFDTVGYAAIPIGVAAGVDSTAAWVASAVLLATFYLNSVSWGYMSALLEKRGRGSTTTGQPTSAAIPRGLIEGTETIIFFSVALAFPCTASVVFRVIAAAVVVTAFERLIWARHALS
jgi:phosphatidylglycerophosphate synthase